MSSAPDAAPASSGGRGTLPGTDVGTADVIISLVVVFNFAVAQPLLDLLGRNAPFFVAHDLSGTQVVVIGVVLTLAVPGLLAGAVALVKVRLPQIGTVIYLGLFAALLSALALTVTAGSVPIPAVALIAIAAVLGLLAVTVYARYPAPRQFIRFGLIAPPVFLLLFLFNSQASSLVWDGGTSELHATVGRPAPVVFLMLDEFPLVSLLDDTGRIDRGRYPSFRRLADDGAWFRNATTVHPSTEHALPAMLTGSMPRSPDSLPIASDHPPSVFELLARDYQMLAVEPVTRFCVQSSCRALEVPDGAPDTRLRTTVADMAIVYLHIALPPRLTGDLPAVDEQWAGFAQQVGGTAADRETLQEAHEARLNAAPESDSAANMRRFIAAIEPRAEPTFYYGHFMMPHLPWTYLPSGAQYTNNPVSLPGMIDSKRWGPDGWFTRHGYRRHLLQAEFTDRLVGELLGRLDETGLYDEALLIVASDHGTSFLPETRRRTMDRDALGEVAYVPLFMKLPDGADPPSTDRPVQTIDIIPTIADVLDVDPVPEMDGRTVLDGDIPLRDRFVLYQGETQADFPVDAGYVEEAADRKYRSFTDADGTFDLFRSGEYGDLVGEPVGPRVSGETSRLSIKVGGIEEFGQVDPDSTFLPAFVRGPVEPNDDAALSRFLAFAVDGRIGGIAKTFEHGSMGIAYETLLDPDLLRPGSNELTAFEIEDTGGSITLHEIRITNR